MCMTLTNILKWHKRYEFFFSALITQLTRKRTIRRTMLEFENFLLNTEVAV